jgi:hypothetical protein
MVNAVDTLPEKWPERLGFRSGRTGVHNSRTLSLRDFQVVLDKVPSDATNAAYRSAIKEDNILSKETGSTRHYVAQRLSQLYGLDHEIPIFRIFRHLWDEGEEGRPLLAMLLALARDPILRTTAPSILQMAEGEDLEKEELQKTIATEEGDRFNETSRKKIAQMTASSWTQSGHLDGRYNKTRTQPVSSVPAAVYALVLGFMSGARGPQLFETFWVSVLDIEEHEVHDYAKRASRRDLLTYRNAGGMIEVDFSQLLTEEDREVVHEQD